MKFLALLCMQAQLIQISQTVLSTKNGVTSQQQQQQKICRMQYPDFTVFTQEQMTNDAVSPAHFQQVEKSILKIKVK